MSDTASGDKLGLAVRKLGSADAAVCAAFNRLSCTTTTRILFRTVSRLGDGVFWYVLMAALPVVAGLHGPRVAAHMLLTSAIALLVWVLLPYTALVAISRMVLGLHYPTDVLAGAAIGGVIGSLSLDVGRLMAWN